MDEVKIKYQNQVCYIICQTNKFYDFIRQLENKLKNDFFHKNDYFKAYFSFPFSLSAQEYDELYLLCDIYKTIILGFSDINDSSKMKLMEYCFYSGNTYYLKEDVVYIGDIEKDVYITTNSNLYIVGEVKGKIDILHQDLELSASSFKDAKIRIFDSQFQNVTNLAPCKVYYIDGKIKQT